MPLSKQAFALAAAVALVGLLGWVMLNRDAAPPPAPAVTPGPWLAGPTTVVRDLERSEALSKEAGNAVHSTVIRGVLEGDYDKVASGLTDDFEGWFPGPDPAAMVDDGGVWLWVLPADHAAPRLGKQAFVDHLQRHLGPLATIERGRWKVFDVAASSTRTKQSAHFGFGGIDTEGHRVEVRGTATVQVVKRGAQWKLRRLQIDEASWARSAIGAFRDLAPLVGFGFNPSAEAEAAVQAVIDNRRLVTVGGLTILDWNHDGFWDVLATYANRETKLFENDGTGGFVTKRLPLLDEPDRVSKFHLWLDLDDDGAEELVGTQVIEYGEHTAELGLYTIDAKGRMKRQKRALVFDIPPWMRRISYESIVACDVNADQRLDLIFVGYSHIESVEHKRLIEANDGLRNLVFINEGGLKFTEQARQRGLVETKYSFVAECRDFDGDGDPDIFVGNDYGKNNYYENLGEGRYRHDTTHPFHLGASFSMSVSIADYDNTGAYAMSVSNMYSHAGHRIVGLAEGLDDDFRKQMTMLVSGNNFYAQRDGRWQNVADEVGVEDSGWAWGNIFFDIDNDGDKDLYVVNGFTTNSDPHLPDF